MTEAELWHYIQNGLPEVHWSRLESGHSATGIFDINGCYQGVECWIELKVQGHELRPSQKAWGVARFRAGGNIWVINHWVRKRLLDIFTFERAVLFLKYPLEPTVSVGLPVKNWEAIRKMLFKEKKHGKDQAE
jgi:hypothetical protein